MEKYFTKRLETNSSKHECEIRKKTQIYHLTEKFAPLTKSQNTIKQVQEDVGEAELKKQIKGRPNWASMQTVH